MIIIESSSISRLDNILNVILEEQPMTLMAMEQEFSSAPMQIAIDTQWLELRERTKIFDFEENRINSLHIRQIMLSYLTIKSFRRECLSFDQLKHREYEQYGKSNSWLRNIIRQYKDCVNAFKNNERDISVFERIALLHRIHVGLCDINVSLTYNQYTSISIFLRWFLIFKILPLENNLEITNFYALNDYVYIFETLEEKNQCLYEHEKKSAITMSACDISNESMTRNSDNLNNEMINGEKLRFITHDRINKIQECLSYTASKCERSNKNFKISLQKNHSVEIPVQRAKFQPIRIHYINNFIDQTHELDELESSNDPLFSWKNNVNNVTSQFKLTQEQERIMEIIRQNVLVASSETAAATDDDRSGGVDSCNIIGFM